MVITNHFFFRIFSFFNTASSGESSLKLYCILKNQYYPANQINLGKLPVAPEL